MIWWINYDFNWVRWLAEFHEHKISNTGWVRNGDERERSGTERNQKECSTFLNLHFLDQKWSKDLEFALAKLRGLCKSWQIYNLHGRVYGLHFSICTQAKQENQCNEASLPWKRAQRYLNINYGEISLRRNLLHCRQKTTTSLWNEMKWKGKARKMQSD